MTNPANPVDDQIAAAQQDPLRISACDLRVGETATIFGTRAGQWPAGNSFITGTITAVEQITLSTTADPGLRFTFDDGKKIDAIFRAVSWRRVTNYDLDEEVKAL